MASFFYAGVGVYNFSGDNATYNNSFTSINQTLTDNEPDGTFEVGDPMFISGTGAPAGTYRGSIIVNGNECVVLEYLGQIYICSPINLPPAAYPATFTFSGDVDMMDFVVCFAPGTMIATPSGECAVETLAIGDPVLTADGEVVPVKWIGRQTVHKAFTPAERFVPVRVKAGALGHALPHSDLVLTGDHALEIDGLLINASALVNEDTIVWEPFDTLPERLTYFHVETKRHDMIIANGAAAETFVDHVTRRRFDNFAEYEAVYGDEQAVEMQALPRISAARLLPAPIRERIAAKVAA